MGRRAVASMLVALLVVAACSDDDGGATSEPPVATDEVTSTSEPDPADQLDAVRTAFDRTIDARTASYVADTAVESDLPIDVRMAIIASGAYDEAQGEGDDREQVLTFTGAGEPTTTAIDVVVVDGTLWVPAADADLGWPIEAAEASPALAELLELVDLDPVLAALRDSTTEVLDHLPLVGGADHWIVLARPPGLEDAPEAEVTVKTRTGGTIAEIGYEVTITGQQLTGLLGGPTDTSDAIGTVTLTVRYELVASDRDLASPVAAPCSDPVEVDGPDGATLRCALEG